MTDSGHASPRDPGEQPTDPDAQPADPHDYLRDDDHLGPLVEEYGEVELDPTDDLFERLVSSIVSQQVSGAAADAMLGRLHDSVEVSPRGILAADEETLREAGLSRQKTRYVTAAAETFDERGWDHETFTDFPDDEVRERLTGITGVGDWTADMLLMFGLGRPDVFPVGDLGIRKGMEIVLDREMTRAEMVEEAERWAPYRSYASLYLWRAKRADPDA